MKSLIAWIIFGLASLVCLYWVGTGVVAELREDAVFHDVIKERAERATNGDILTIGVAGTWAAHDNVLTGIRHGVENLNASGGILGRTIELDIREDHGTVEGALEVAQAFATDPDIGIVIGHTSAHLNLAVAQNYEFYQILNMSPSAPTAGNGEGGYTLQFSNGPSPIQLGNSLLDLAQDKKWSRIGLVYTKSGYHQRQARLFESLADNRMVQVPLSFAYTGQDLTHELARWERELDLDALVLSLDMDDTQKLIKLVRNSRMHLPIISTGQLPEITQAKGYGDLYYLHGKSEAGDEELTTSPVSEFALGYESIVILARSAEQAQSLHAKDIAEALHGLHLDPPLLSTIHFGPDGNAIKKMPPFTKL